LGQGDIACKRTDAIMQLRLKIGASQGQQSHAFHVRTWVGGDVL
jgi:hypothetical protein